MPKKKTEKQEEQDLKEAMPHATLMSHFKELASPDEDEVDDVEVITNTELTELVEEQVVDGMSYADKKSVPPDEDDDDEPVSHHTIRDRDYYEKQDTEIRQAYLEGYTDGLAEAEHIVYKKHLQKTQLIQAASGVEGKWITHIWNQVIKTKLFLKNKTRNNFVVKPNGTQIKKQRYKKTNQTDMVGSYNEFKARYKNKRTRQAMELKIRKIGFFALDMGDTYNADDWIQFIATNTDVDDFDDMLDAITDQLDTGFKI